MKLHLIELNLAFKKGHETIKFTDFTYFYGQMGAGKSTIARLVDYCFGGNLGEGEMTPALQQEFIAAELTIEVEDTVVSLERTAGESKIRAFWTKGDDALEVLVPARVAAGEVIAGSGVETLSDLIYYLAGITPPKVRRSKLNEDSDLERLSLRNLLWYCYLDQDSMDSSFFHLERGGDQWKKLDSRDVVRYLVGFHQERVAELEAKLELLRSARQQNEGAAKAMQDALDTADIGDGAEILAKRHRLDNELAKIDQQLDQVRQELKLLRTHAAEQLQAAGRDMAQRLNELYLAGDELAELLKKDRAHRNELASLSSRFTRSQSARELLAGVEFKGCPKCGQDLPQRGGEVCTVCGQVHAATVTSSMSVSALRDDLEARKSELDEVIDRQERQLRLIEKEIEKLSSEKGEIDIALNESSADYDSAYLSSALDNEKRRAAIVQELKDLEKLEAVARKIDELNELAGRLVVQEKGVKEALKKEREKAEKDTKNLKLLREFFLDCLVRSKVSGFLEDDVVEMSAPHFLPEVHPADEGDATVVSFTNLGSGGKKTLFKCCFAIAMHRLSNEVGGILPSFLIIDTPMKSISERENKEQFEGFFEMLYDLSQNELADTQFVVIDKELCTPAEGYTRSFMSRHMKPNAVGQAPSDNPDSPLIPYYTGK